MKFLKQTYLNWPYLRKGQIHIIRLLLVGCLIVLRFPLLILSAMLFPSTKNMASAICETGTYILSAGLIWIERGRLLDFNIDGFVLWMFLLLKPTETIVLRYIGFPTAPVAFPHFASILIWGTAVLLFIGISHWHRGLLKIQLRSVFWYCVGIVGGLSLAVVLSFPASFRVENVPVGNHYSTWSLITNSLQQLVYQTGYAALTEEPLFRGFLWGYLRKTKLGPVGAWLLIALLFWFAHLYFINVNPISFFITVPVAALVFGFISWRSRTIASSIGMHGMVNAIGYQFAVIMMKLRMR